MRILTPNMNTSRIDITSEYNLDVVNAIKLIPDRTWDIGRKMWSIPMTSFHLRFAMDVLKEYDFQVAARLNILIEDKPTRFIHRDGLYNFQSEAIDFLDKANGRALIADEQGLGKTIEALYWISTKPDIKSILVICPASVIYKWEAEIKKWDKSRTVQVLRTSKEELSTKNYIIMSYSIMTRRNIELTEQVWDCVIFDEVHRLKEPKAMRSRAAKSIESKYLLALSGTPLVNRPVEFYNILHMINPSQWGTWWSFTQRYCGAHNTYWGRDVTGASNLEELSARLHGTMIRRLKKEVLQELPDITRTKMPILVDASEINQAYRSLWETLHKDRVEREGNDVLAQLTVLREAVGRAKVDTVVEIAKDLLDANSEKKIVIYAVHKEVVRRLEEQLKPYGVSTITGDVNNEERSKRQLKFQNGYMPRVMVISMAGGEGIDLYRADSIIFAEREWTPAAEEQAEGRLHRIGQKCAVEAIYLIASNTVDEDIDNLIESKRYILGQVIIQPEIQTREANISDSIKGELLSSIERRMK